MILEGKKKSLVKKLEKEMKAFAKIHEFEKAGEVRNKIFALNHIRDVALIGSDKQQEQETWRKNDLSLVTCRVSQELRLMISLIFPVSTQLAQW